MRFFSTNKKLKNIPLKQVLLSGLADDGGLFMPNKLPKLPKKFFQHLGKISFAEIADVISRNFISEISRKDLHRIIKQSFNFPVPLRHLRGNIYILELFHGPTMAFKDFGARFLSRATGYFLKGLHQPLNIVVATSGDTGSAVASGFFKVPNVRVFILYPSGKVSPLQEKQLTTYGHNITALEVKGTFDDCQKLAKQVLADAELNRVMKFSSANSINFGRLLPQSFYYFWAAGQLKRQGINQTPVVVVPSGNFGNLFAGLMAKKMGLPVKKFVAATNSNNVVLKYLQTGRFYPTKSKHTISNAMDVGNPSNFARMQNLYHNNYKKMARDIKAFSVSDSQTMQTIKQMYSQTGHILDPHTAVGVVAAYQYNQSNPSAAPIIVLSTAHPAKFKEVVEPVIGRKIVLPKQLQSAMGKKQKSIKIYADYQILKKLLMNLK